MKSRTLFSSSIVGIVAILGLLCFAAAVQAGQIYTFDYPGRISAGGLVGQDGWAPWATVPTSTQLVQVGSGSNTTMVSGSPVGPLDLHNSSGINSRINDSNWSYTPYTGTETDATTEFDVLYSPTGVGAPTFALGYDANSNGALDSGTAEVGPFFGLRRSGTTYSFYMRESGFGSNITTTELVSTVLGNGANAGDWLRLRMVVDFTANSGDGSADLYIADLTRGDLGSGGIGWTPVTTMQNKNVKLNHGPSPSTWNGMITRIDNDTTNDSLLDNLHPNVNAVVPEPSTLALLGMGLIGLLAYAWRKRK